jgi:hypothetical protein
MPQPQSAKRVMIQYLPENVSIGLVHVAVVGSRVIFLLFCAANERKKSTLSSQKTLFLSQINTII